MKFSKTWAESAGKKKFIAQHRHLADDKELSKEFDKMFPKKRNKN